MFGIDDALLGAGIQAGGSILSGLFGSDASSDAANAQSQAAQQALQVQTLERDRARAQNMPFANAGTNASDRLQFLLGLGGRSGIGAGTRKYRGKDGVSLNEFLQAYDNPEQVAADPTQFANVRAAFEREALSSDAQADQGNYGSLTRDFTANDLNADPVYQSGLKFGLDQGTGAINARAIQNGGYDSGATLKALTRFGNDYGRTKAGESYNRFTGNQNNIYNKLAGQQAVGVNATNQNAANGLASAGAQGELITGMGNAQSAGIVGGANSMAGAFGGIGTAIQGYQNNQILNKLLGQRGNNAATSFGTNDGGPGGWN